MKYSCVNEEEVWLHSLGCCICGRLSL